MEPAENKEGVEVEVVTEMVVGECVDGVERVMCWEVVKEGEILACTEDRS